MIKALMSLNLHKISSCHWFPQETVLALVGSQELKTANLLFKRSNTRCQPQAIDPQLFQLQACHVLVIHPVKAAEEGLSGIFPASNLHSGGLLKTY